MMKGITHRNLVRWSERALVGGERLSQSLGDLDTDHKSSEATIVRSTDLRGPMKHDVF